MGDGSFKGQLVLLSPLDGTFEGVVDGGPYATAVLSEDEPADDAVRVNLANGLGDVVAGPVPELGGGEVVVHGIARGHGCSLKEVRWVGQGEFG